MTWSIQQPIVSDADPNCKRQHLVYN